MNNLILKMYVKSQTLWSTLKDDQGQDLVEYALVIALVALAATAGMGTLANGINTAFNSLGSKLSSYTSYDKGTGSPRFRSLLSNYEQELAVAARR